MGNKNVIEVYADYIYYIPIGDKNKIDYIKNILTTANVDKHIEYISIKASVPIAIHHELLEKNRGCNIQLDSVVEEAHAHAFAHYDILDAHMLICLKMIDGNYILTPPRFVIVDGNDPQKGLIKEFSRLSQHKLDTMIANTVKPIAIIGQKKDTVLYVSRFTNKRIAMDNTSGDMKNLLSFLESMNGDA